MPRFHLVSSPENPEYRFSFQYSGRNDLEDAKYFQNGSPIMRLSTPYSFILVDTTIPEELGEDALDKLHVEQPDGTLLFQLPHAERFVDKKEGPRADLWWFDGHYARVWLNELEKWTDSGNRLSFIQRIQNRPFGWTYSIPHRKKQVQISDKGVEKNIEEVSACLEREPYVHEAVQQMSRDYLQAIAITNSIATKIPRSPKGKNNDTKLISGGESDTAINYFVAINEALMKTLRRINQEIEERGLKEAVNKYWDDEFINSAMNLSS